MNSAEIAYYQQRSSTHRVNHHWEQAEAQAERLKRLKKLIVVSGEYQGSK